MTTDENKQLVMEGYQLFQKGEIPELLQRYHDDAVWTQPETVHVPYGGTHTGRAGIGRMFQLLNESVEILRFQPEQFMADGDKVVVTGHGAFRTRQTGMTYASAWAHVFTLRDGKVAHAQTYFDTGAAERAFTAMPMNAGAGEARPALRQ